VPVRGRVGGGGRGAPNHDRHEELGSLYDVRSNSCGRVRGTGKWARVLARWSWTRKSRGPNRRTAQMAPSRRPRPPSESTGLRDGDEGGSRRRAVRRVGPKLASGEPTNSVTARYTARTPRFDLEMENLRRGGISEMLGNQARNAITPGKPSPRDSRQGSCCGELRRWGSATKEDSRLQPAVKTRSFQMTALGNEGVVRSTDYPRGWSAETSSVTE